MRIDYMKAAAAKSRKHTKPAEIMSENEDKAAKRKQKKEIEKQEEFEDPIRTFTLLINSLEKMKLSPPNTDVMIKAEFKNEIVKESEKIPCINGCVPFKLEVLFQWNRYLMEDIDSMVSYPIVFSVYEIVPVSSPKETKKVETFLEEDNIQLYGRCCLDLLPFLQGETTINETLPVQPKVLGIGKDLVTWANLPQLSVTMTTPKAFFSHNMQQNMVIINFTLEGMYNLKEPMKDDLIYTAATTMPISPENYKTVMFGNGIYTKRQYQDGMKCWNTLPHIYGRASYTALRVPTNVQEIYSDFKQPFRSVITSDAPHIEWYRVKRCMVSKEMAMEMMENIESKEVMWPIEIYIPSKLPDTTKQKSKEMPPVPKAKHYVAYVDFKQIGLSEDQRCRAASLLYKYDEKEFAYTAYNFSPVFDPAYHNYNMHITDSEMDGMLENINAMMNPLLPKYKLEAKVPHPSTKTGDTQPTFVVVEIEFSKFLTKPKSLYLPSAEEARKKKVERLIQIQRRLPGHGLTDDDQEEEETKKEKKCQYYDQKTKICILDEIIKSKDPRYFVKLLGDHKTKDADVLSNYCTVEEKFKMGIGRVSKLIMKIYQEFMQNKLLLHDVVERDDFGGELYLHLQKIGIYNSLRETIRYNILMILHELFIEQSLSFIFPPLTKATIDRVYIYIVENMSDILIHQLMETRYSADNPYIPGCREMYFYALEAEEEGQNEIANVYYLERIGDGSWDNNVWLEYAIFCLGQKWIDRAVECVKEALIGCCTDKLGLMMYGMLLYRYSKCCDAVLFLETMTRLHPRVLEGWMVLHLLYTLLEYYNAAEWAFDMATELSENPEIIEPLTYPCLTVDQLSWRSISDSTGSLYFIIIQFLLKVHMLEFVEMALAQELEISGISIPYVYYLGVHHYKQQRYEDILTHMEVISTESGQECCIWNLLAHTYYKLGQTSKAIYHYKRSRELGEENMCYLHLMNIRYGFLAIIERDYCLAHELFLESCMKRPSPYAWFGIGCTFYKLGRLPEAECALIESHRLFNHNPYVWAYLSLIYATWENECAFKICYREMMIYGFDDEELLKQIKNLREKALNSESAKTRKHVKKKKKVDKISTKPSKEIEKISATTSDDDSCSTKSTSGCSLTQTVASHK